MLDDGDCNVWFFPRDATMVVCKDESIKLNGGQSHAASCAFFDSSAIHVDAWMPTIENIKTIKTSSF
jgi:hypothetical protein